MKYRIVERTRGSRTWYAIQQRNRFLWWTWWSDVEFIIGLNEFNIPETVQEIINEWTAPTFTKEYIAPNVKKEQDS